MANWWRRGGGGDSMVAVTAVWRRWRRQLGCGSLAAARGRRDDGADGVVVGDSGARGDVHCGRRGADYAEGCADDIIC